MRHRRLALALGVLLFGVTCGPAIEPSDRHGLAAVDVLPVIYWDGISEQELHLSFKNSSTSPIRYLFRMDSWPVAFLEVSLFHNGQLVTSTGETFEGPTLDKKLVRALKQGDQLVHVLKLHEQYYKLAPGQYEVEMTYDQVREGNHLVTEYDMTPVEFKDTVLRLVVK